MWGLKREGGCCPIILDVEWSNAKIINIKHRNQPNIFGVGEYIM